MKTRKVITVESPDNVILVDHLGHKVQIQLDFSEEGELWIEVMRTDQEAKILLNQVIKLGEDEPERCEECKEPLTEKTQDREFNTLCLICARDRREG
jgi:hypothetical protein